MGIEKLKCHILILLCIFAVSVLGVPSGRIKRQIADPDYKVVCYFANWAQYRTGAGTFTPADVDPELCTHIIYAFYHISNNVVVNTEPNDQAQLQTLVGYKTLYPDLKILVSIGGWNAGVVAWSQMVQTATNRQTFINSLKYLIVANNLDGVDLDWEFPAMRGSPAGDRELFTVLVQEIRAAFDAENQGWLLTVATGAGKDKIETSYEIAALAQAADFINVMTYDLHGSWNSFTGIHSNLYGISGEAFYFLNANWAIRAYIDAGAPPDKLLLGVASYGKSFTLCSTTSYGPGAPSCGAGNAGPITQTPGILSYSEICSFDDTLWAYNYDTIRSGAYAYYQNQWVGYDSVQTVQEKVDYIISQGLGGGFLWEMSLDDFGNTCGDGSFPILRELNTVRTVSPTPPPIETTSVFETSSGAFEMTSEGMDSSSGSTIDSTISDVTYTIIESTTTHTDTESPGVSTTVSDTTDTTPPTPPQTTSATTSTSTSTSTSTTTTVTTPSQVFTCPRTFGYFKDPLSCNKFYQCVWYRPYLFTCSNGLNWNQRIQTCDWPYHVAC